MDVSSADRPAADHAILLVEDDHGDAVLVQANLEQAGIATGSVTWTRTLGDATEALNEAITLRAARPRAARRRRA